RTGANAALFLSLYLSESEGIPAGVSEKDDQRPDLLDVVLPECTCGSDPAVIAGGAGLGVVVAGKADSGRKGISDGHDGFGGVGVFVLVGIEGRLAVGSSARFFGGPVPAV